MFQFLRFFAKKRYSGPSRDNHVPRGSNQTENMPLDSRLSHNLEELHRLFPHTPDLIVRRLKTNGRHAALVYLCSLIDKTTINEFILQPLLSQSENEAGELPPANIGYMYTGTCWSDLERAILDGDTVLLTDGRVEADIFDTKGWPQRAIEDPQLEATLKGAHQGFVETAIQNVALIRRYIPNRELKFRDLYVGERGKTKVQIVYLADVAAPEVLEELITRISSLKIDTIINSGELAEHIEDNPYSPFPQLILTERPDTVASHILQGRFAVIVDRSPSVMIGPATFISFFQNIDDYSTRWPIASFIRLLRFIACAIALTLPAAYIAFISFNYEVVPVQLMFSIAESRARVPFPPFIEALLMEVTLEMMREAGIRLPAPIGQTVGIVGGIIIGQAAVQAGIVSNIMVIVVASTAIASFIIPNYDMGTTIRLLRFPMMAMAYLFGILGITIGMMVIVAHLVCLESLGTPYGSPLAPFRWADMKDTFVRLPIWSMVKRPKSVRTTQSKRTGYTRRKGGTP
ncbi:spore germination protein [Paenibacillus sp. HJGM_3]|uniref:spore germination protein n=1 Tax=Paenibacillus sp. HJGM_3 TaxID=3379816 RepID=UPI00385D3188